MVELRPVVMDLEMPVIGGVEATQAIVETSAAVAIIIPTASDYHDRKPGTPIKTLLREWVYRSA